MRKFRLLSAFLAFSLVVIGLVAISPANKAEATATWPATIENSYVVDVIAHDDGGFSAMGCNASLVNATNATFVDAQGEIRNNLPSVASEGIQCSHYSQQGFEDGTLYGVRFSTSNNSLAELVSWKNNRELWATDISAPNNCVVGGSWTSKQMHPVSMSQGSDGLVYMILVPEFTPRNCEDRLVGVNPSTGAIVHDIALGTLNQVATPRVWTYEDVLLVLDSKGMVREFDYAGTEDESARYQFSTPSGRSIEQAEANDEGAVFVTTPGGGSTNPKLFYRKADSTGGVIDNDVIWPGLGALSVTHDGSAVGIERNTNTLTWFDLTTDDVAAEVLIPETTGYAKSELASYHEDEDGNAVIQWNHWSLDWQTTATSVDVYDEATDSTDRVFLKEYKASDSTNYPAFMTFSAGMTSNGIADGNLYLAICEDTATNCYSSTQAPDIAIHKIALGSFGNPLGKGFKRNDYESQKLEYVAMGDSFSSGEGIEPFLLGTDVGSPNENRCHRSEDAYPMLLEEDPDLDLNLTASVACSGATTSNIVTSGQWGEPKQLDALSDTTDIVTVTIGGNNVGFVNFATACVVDACDESTSIYSSTMSDISSLGDDLEDVYLQILDSIDDEGQVYVMNYPMMVPMDMEYGDIVNPFCTYMAGATDLGIAYGSWGDARGAQVVIASLNAKIEQSVYYLGDPRIHYVDVSAEFEGHDICSIDSQFIVNQLPPATFHPNGTAQQVLADTMVMEMD